MGFFDAITNFFLPDADTARQRRLDVFGTESKVVTGAVIVGAAGAAIAAPVVLGSVETRAAVGSFAREFAIKNPFTTAAAAGAVGLGTIVAVKNPATVTRSTGATVNIVNNVTDFLANPSASGAKKVVTDNPVATTLVGASGLALIAPSIFNTISGIENRNATNKNTEAMLNTLQGNNSDTKNVNVSPNSNGHDEDIAKANAKASQNIADTNAKASVDIARIQAQSNKDTLDAQLKALSMQPTPIAKKAPAKKKKKAKSKPKKKTIKKKQKKKR